MKAVCLLSLVLFGSSVHAQNDFFQRSHTYNSERVTGVVVAETVFATAMSVALNYLWYKKFSRSKFHHFDDNGEWLNVDKVGHATTAYNIAAIQSSLLQWGGVKPGTAAIAGSLTSLGLMTLIELMDGHSEKWGFSNGDMVANLAGCALFQGQQLAWGEQRMSLKYSYHHTLFAKYYPQELGKNTPQRMLKDYNGQSYWLSLNIGSFLPGNTDFPKWLNVAAGYGAEGMIGAFKNPKQINGQDIPDFDRYRQFYFSFDTDLFRINNITPLTSTLLRLNGTLKMPAPAIEWNKKEKLQMHWLYY